MSVIAQHLIAVFSALPSDSSALDSSISALKSSISALEVSIKTLDGKSVFWETLLLPFSALVIVGVGLEVWALLWDHGEAMADWRRGIVLPPERPSTGKLWLEVVATLLVVIGVAGELATSGKIASINGQLRMKNSDLRSASDQLLALVTQEAGDASKSASDANEAAGEARADADAVEADLLKLRKETGARRLTEKQKREIGDALSANPTPIEVCRSPLDSEAEDFAVDLGNALGKGHWTVAYLNWFPNGKYGLYIGFTDSIARDLPQVKLLKKALGDVGFPPQLLQLPPGDKSLSTPAESHVLYLLVAAHPPIPTSAKTVPKATP